MAAGRAAGRYVFRLRTYRVAEAIAPRGKIETAADAAHLMAAIFVDECDLNVEQFCVLGLNARGHACFQKVVSKGTISATLVHPREVFGPAIVTDVAAIILGHNHPSGDVTPSEDDRALTKRMRSAGELLGIPVVDSVIIAIRDGRAASHCSILEV